MLFVLLYSNLSQVKPNQKMIAFLIKNLNRRCPFPFLVCLFHFFVFFLISFDCFLALFFFEFVPSSLVYFISFFPFIFLVISLVHILDLSSFLLYRLLSDLFYSRKVQRL